MNTRNTEQRYEKALKEIAALSLVHMSIESIAIKAVQIAQDALRKAP